MEFDDQDLQLINNVCENGNFLEDADDDIRNQGKSFKFLVRFLNLVLNCEKSAILFVMLKISLKLSRRFLGSSLLVSRLYFVKSD